MENRIISISRQFGSGGHEVAVKTADLLGIRVYERELIRLACEYGELSEKTLSPSDEKATNPYLFQTVHEGNHHVLRGKPTSEVLFALQSHEIRRIARHEECVFVGRCADYVLREENVKLLTVFVSAPDEHRIQRKMAQEKLTRDQAVRLIRKMDKQRRKYYESYTDRIWGHRRRPLPQAVKSTAPIKGGRTLLKKSFPTLHPVKKRQFSKHEDWRFIIKGSKNRYIGNKIGSISLPNSDLFEIHGSIFKPHPYRC